MEEGKRKRMESNSEDSDEELKQSKGEDKYVRFVALDGSR